MHPKFPQSAQISGVPTPRVCPNVCKLCRQFARPQLGVDPEPPGNAESAIATFAARSAAGTALPMPRLGGGSLWKGGKVFLGDL